MMYVVPTAPRRMSLACMTNSTTVRGTPRHIGPKFLGSYIYLHQDNIDVLLLIVSANKAFSG
eukprot:5002483-Pleurochrysis_carterae.AAC.1